MDILGFWLGTAMTFIGLFGAPSAELKNKPIFLMTGAIGLGIAVHCSPAMDRRAYVLDAIERTTINEKEDKSKWIFREPLPFHRWSRR